MTTISHKTTKAELFRAYDELSDQLIAARAEIERLRTAAHVAGHKETRPKAIDGQRPIVPVYEWNPDIEGDFKRALGLARENNGRVQRVRTGVPA